MRALIGLAMLTATALGGVSYLSQDMPQAETSNAASLQGAQRLLGSAAFSGVVQTVAAADSAVLPPVNAAPDAPRATPIEPIVEPMKRNVPKPVATAKSHAAQSKSRVKSTKTAKTKPDGDKPSGVTVTRPGFKLTCSATQKLDTSKQRCVPLKGHSTATVKKQQA